MVTKLTDGLQIGTARVAKEEENLIHCYKRWLLICKQTTCFEDEYQFYVQTETKVRLQTWHQLKTILRSLKWSLDIFLP